jgi:hypothetical protein
LWLGKKYNTNSLGPSCQNTDTKQTNTSLLHSAAAAGNAHSPVPTVSMRPAAGRTPTRTRPTGHARVILPVPSVCGALCYTDTPFSKSPTRVQSRLLRVMSRAPHKSPTPHHQPGAHWQIGPHKSKSNPSHFIYSSRPYAAEANPET